MVKYKFNGKRLKLARISREMNQIELAKLVGLESGASLVSQMEKGQKHPSLKRFELIANKLKVSPNFLMGGSSLEELEES